MQQQQRHRLSDDVAPSDDDRVRSGYGNPAALEKRDDAHGRARDQVGAVLDQKADVRRVKPVDILCGVDGIEHLLHGAGAHAWRQGGLDEDGVVERASIQPLDQRQDVVERRRGRKPLEVGPDACLLCRLELADVDLGGRRPPTARCRGLAVAGTVSEAQRGLAAPHIWWATAAPSSSSRHRGR